MKQPIVDYDLDEENHWVAELPCGHFQHVRQEPPLENRIWVTPVEGRASMHGFEPNCLKCDESDCDEARINGSDVADNSAN